MSLSHEIKKRLIFIILSIVTLILLYWFFFVRGIESTDDAYLKGNITILNPKVSGYVIEVLVKDNQHVKKGEIIAKIDQRDFIAKVQQATAELQSLKAKQHILENQFLSQQENVKATAAEVEAAKAGKIRAEKEFKRTSSLIKDGAISESSNEMAAFKHQNGQAFVQKSQAIYERALLELKVITAQIEEITAMIKKAEAGIALAEIDLQNTNIISPKDGFIGNRGVQVGQLARPGLALAYLIPDNEIWIEANLKETQIGKMRPGQHVGINIDAFPDKSFTGKIESIAPASGSEFSILPPENATGNFTKIVQRIMVKITFDQDTDLSLLKPGMSSVVDINVR